MCPKKVTSLLFTVPRVQCDKEHTRHFDSAGQILRRCGENPLPSSFRAMDSQYGIAVRNKFELAFLDEDEDPLEILRLQEEEKSKKKDEKPKGKDAKSQKDTKSSKNKKNKALTTSQEQKPKSAEPREVKRDGENCNSCIFFP